MLTAALVSAFLWVAVSADTVRQDTILADLVLINGDRRYVLTNQEPETDVVSVVFTGRAGDMARLLVSRPQVFVSIDSVESQKWEINLSPDMVTGRGGRELEDVRALSVSPEQLTLTFQPRAQKVVPVIPVVNLGIATGYALADSPQVDPGAVQIEGPERIVTRIDSVFTVPVVRDGVTETVNVEVPLEEPEPQDVVSLSTQVVRVTVGVEPSIERVFPAIPLSVSGVDITNFRIEPSLVDVRISGPRSAVAGVRPETLAPIIQIDGPQDVGRYLPIRLPASDPLLNVSVEPDSARVIEREVSPGPQPPGGE